MAEELLQQGVVTTDMPYAITEIADMESAITFRGQPALDIRYISLFDAEGICAAMNLAYQNGYSAGATMMLNKEKTQ
jgi:hypothetical protein